MNQPKNHALFAGSTPLHTPPADAEATGEFVTRHGCRFYVIRQVDRMAPFFMTVVSPGDHWMFIGSNGGLTTGRQNSQSALFPYYTVDKVMDGAPYTGPLTRMLVEHNGRRQLWAPFAAAYQGVYAVERNLYKSVTCDTVIFEEVNCDLGLTFSYTWSFSDRFGLVRSCHLSNQGEATRVNLLDGVQNLLPHGVGPDGQNLFSNLQDAYKRSEYRTDAGLAVFALSSRLTDKAEPSEALRATTAWADGLAHPAVLLSARQVDTFARRERLETEPEICGDRCAFLLQDVVDLPARGQHAWRMVFELNQDHTAVADLAARLIGDRANLLRDLEADLRDTAGRMEHLIAQVDGLQAGGVESTSAHHFANVLFNTMRGGLYADGYRLGRDDVLRYLKVMNREVYAAQRATLESLPEHLTLDELKAAAQRTGSRDLQRLGRQYLPLTFSRRHGDPSRPWNQFSINIRNPDGSRRLDYQGNWRDIFQNWEALNLSYPEFFENSISVFLNLITADGYNPYRVSRDGAEWEKPEPHNIWSNIGYWGDHQIIYLLKLLEWSEVFQPETLAHLLDTPAFSHAQVPYLIKPYEALLADPFDSIVFDTELEARILERTQRLGADGRLLMGPDGQVFHSSLVEKLLILLLVKLSNYVPGAGIWMNTQRPEWNDANNALVGRGASVVTLGYLRRFAAFLLRLLPTGPQATFALEATLADFLEQTESVLQRHDPAPASRQDKARRAVMDELGRAGGAYRAAYYEKGLSLERRPITRERLATFLRRSLDWMDEGLRANRREDGLYHAYNSLVIGPEETGITYLKEMLEGQVSILSSGVLTGEEATQLLAALRQSALYRADQQSYILYPNLPPPGFLHKNTIPPERLAGAPLLGQLLARGDRRLVSRDQTGAVHFQGDLRNRTDVLTALRQIADAGQPVHEQARDQVVNLFEEVFDHARYTGRSGTFFAYEGLGSVYWHMVTKLMLAVQEIYFDALDKGADGRLLQALADHYYGIRAGLGFNKTPARYGAFPTDPYSHTPWGKGAQQPGMTGQVKEEILTRMGELGIRIRAGNLHFEPRLLREDEWLAAPSTFSTVDANGTRRTWPLAAGMLAFTFCQVPVLYDRSGPPRIDIHFADGTQESRAGRSCGPELTRAILCRDGRVVSLHVYPGP